MSVAYINVCNDWQEYEIKRVRGDGSCFFHSVSVSMYKSDKRSDFIRFCVVDYVYKNFDKYKYFTLKRDGNCYSDREEYFVEMSNANTFATTCEIYIFSKIFYCNLIIYNKNSILLKYVYDEKDSNLFVRKNVRILCVSDGTDLMNTHFEPIVKRR